jgi:undecaprenyl-diphosphatase
MVQVSTGNGWLGLSSHRTDSKILIGFLACSVAAFSLAWLASEVLEGDMFAIDRAILVGLRSRANAALPIGPQWLTTSVLDLTALGSVTVLTLITILSVGFLIALEKHSTAVFVALAVSSGALLSSGLKNIFVRARPEIVPHLVNVSSASFPSGHALNSALVYLTLAALLARAQQSLLVRIYLITVAILLTLLVGVSRLYLGVHWPSDVVAGWSVGAAWAAICSLVGKALQRHRAIDKPVREQVG